MDLVSEAAFVASLAAAALAVFGVAIAALNLGWAERRRYAVTAFASGVLVATAILHLIPEGLGASRFGAALVFAGYVVMYAIGEIFGAAPQEQGGRLIAFPAIIGIGFHSFVDGLEYPILFAHDVFTGLLATSGLIVHELAEGVIVFTILRGAGARTAAAVGLALIVAAATTPLGAFMSLRLMGGLGEETVGSLMSLAAGALLYVGATHLPRHLGPERRLRAFPSFVLGAALAGALALTHGLEGGHIH